MRLVFGSDHAGLELKQALMPVARELGHEVTDVGAYDSKPSDYPDFAEAVGNVLGEGGADRGVLVCGSGVGVSVAANKMPGIRAGLCHDTYSAHQGVEHDNMNVLVLGSRIIGVELAKDLLRTYLSAEFTREERHVRRVGKVAAMERRYLNARGNSDAGE